MKKFLIMIPFIGGCSSVKKQLSPFGNTMSVDEGTAPIETAVQMSIFDSTNLFLWLSLSGIAGYFVWREFKKSRPQHASD